LDCCQFDRGAGLVNRRLWLPVTYPDDHCADDHCADDHCTDDHCADDNCADDNCADNRTRGYHRVPLSVAARHYSKRQ